jgi:hypothetical protein
MYQLRRADTAWIPIPISGSVARQPALSAGCTINRASTGCRYGERVPSEAAREVPSDAVPT